MELDLKIVIAGIGGQGILFMARLLYEMAGIEGIKVLGGETHGMSQRGGSVTSHVKIGDYHSPMVREGTADFLFILKPEEACANLRFLRKGGHLLVNAPDGLFLSKGVLDALKQDEILIFRKDATECALELGNPMAANVILLSSSLGSGIFPMDSRTLIKAVRSVSPARFLEKTLDAVKAGSEL